VPNLNIRDAESAILLGWDKAEKISKEFDSQWEEPNVKAMFGGMISNMPAMMREQLKKNNPQGYKEAMKLIGGDDENS
jgi:hypothetical protein